MAQTRRQSTGGRSRQTARRPRQVRCKNCGAGFPFDLEACPYCGTQNQQAAYRNFREKLSALGDKLLGLEGETEQSLSRGILFACLRGLVLAAAVILLAFACSTLAKPESADDVRYDRETLEDIEWLNENLDQLEAAYSAGDLQTLERLSYENYAAFRTWRHAEDYERAREAGNA